MVKIKTFVFLLVILTLNPFCSTKQRARIINENEFTDLPITENFRKILYFGIETKIDSSNFLELAVHRLNLSDYAGCLNIMKKSMNLDTIWCNGFYGFTNREKVPICRELEYLFYRINQYNNDLDPWHVNLVPIVNPEDSMFDFFTMEGDFFIDYFKLTNRNRPEEVLVRAKKLKKKYPFSKRLDFIIASESLILGDEYLAFKIFDNLISQDYAVFEIIKFVLKNTNFLKSTNKIIDYTNHFHERFSNYFLLNDSLRVNSIQAAIEYCSQASKTGSQREYRLARLFTANFLLENEDYFHFDSISSVYYSQPWVVKMDTIQKKEETFFKYSQLKSFFKQKKFDNASLFIKMNVGSIDISLNILDKGSYKDFIKKIYFQFVSSDLHEFEKIYKDKFEACFD